MRGSWRSSLEIYDVKRGTLRVIFRTPQLIEAPNWHPDGGFLVNGDGRLWHLPEGAKALRLIDTGPLTRCNNDHGFLPDGRIVFSCHQGDQGSGIYVLEEGGPRQIVPDRPSWWHAAQGNCIAYPCARGGDRVVRIAEMDLRTGRERVLTPGRAHHDGPDYSACGTFIWFNSDATGHAQIWRMRRDGTEAMQVFADDRVNWFPHPSPCGGHILYLSYPAGTEGHPRDLPVSLWLMSPEGADRRPIVALFGGQGSLNVPCWSADGSAFAFMRYAPE